MQVLTHEFLLYFTFSLRYISKTSAQKVVSFILFEPLKLRLRLSHKLADDHLHQKKWQTLDYIKFLSFLVMRLFSKVQQKN